VFITSRAEAAGLLGELPAWAVYPHTCRQRPLVNINPATALMDSLYGRLLCAGARGHTHIKEILLCVLEATMRGTTVCPAAKLSHGIPMRLTAFVAPVQRHPNPFSSPRGGSQTHEQLSQSPAARV
jgi:hypothetical protein